MEFDVGEVTGAAFGEKTRHAWRSVVNTENVIGHFSVPDA